jgi:hypothetical protein
MSWAEVRSYSSRPLECRDCLHFPPAGVIDDSASRGIVFHPLHRYRRVQQVSGYPAAALRVFRVELGAAVDVG